LAEQHLYVGVAVGTEFCGAESAAVRDPTFWTVTIGMFQHEGVGMM